MLLRLGPANEVSGPLLLSVSTDLSLVNESHEASQGP